MAEPNDQQLIVAFLHGNEQALGVLIGSYLKPIYNFVARYVGDGIEAEDLTQEIFVKMWRNLHKFNQAKSFKTWLYTIARNTALDYFKRNKTVLLSAFEDENGENVLLNRLADPSANLGEMFEQRELADYLRSAVARLTPKYQKVVNLHINEQLSFIEIARYLHESIDTVKSRYRRALLRLRDVLGESR